MSKKLKITQTVRKLGYRGKGKKFHTIIRGLAFKWIRILFRCWKNQTPYNDTNYMEVLKKRGSIFATLHLEQNA